MRWQRWLWPALFCGLLLAGVTAAVVGALPGVPAWGAAVLGALGLLVAPLRDVARDMLTEARTRNSTRRRLLPQHCLVDGANQLPLVRDMADPLLLGVHRAAEATGLHQLGLAEGVPLYLPRACDADLDRALPEGGLVLLEGHSAAGKSRTAFEAMHRALPDRTLLVPREAGSLRELVDSGHPIRDVVIWLDDIERFLGPSGLDIHLLHQLCGNGRTDVTLVATMRSEERKNFELVLQAAPQQSTERQIARSTSRVLEMATVVTVSRELSERERTAAADRIWDDPRVTEALDQVSGVGLAEYLAAGPATLQRWHQGRDGIEYVGAAIVSAAVDVRRCGFLRPVGRQVLTSLYRHYLDPHIAHRPDLATFEDGLAWAIQPVRGASSCLMCDEDDTYSAFDYLVGRTQDDPASAQVPQPAWDAVYRLAEPDDSLYVGQAAHDAGRIELAERAFRRALTSGQSQLHIDAAFSLGVVLHDRGRAAESERWCRLAAEAGHTVGMNNLGVLLENRGELAEAEQWYLRSARADYPDAMFNMGLLLENRGQFGDALDWYRRAADAGLAEAWLQLGLQAERDGEPAAADAAYREASDLPEARYRLGVLREREATEREAAHWRALAGRGDADAMWRCARVLALIGEVAESTEADDWLERAAQAGSPAAMHDLGYRRLTEGDEAGALRWYLAAAESGHAQSMNDLGFLLRMQGDDDQAETWWRSCAETGSREAMYDLGFLLILTGRPREAESWFRLGDSGDIAAVPPDEPFVPERQEADEQAAEWFRSSANGQGGAPAWTEAMNHLGHLHRRRGEVGPAETWWRHAAAAGDADAMTALGHLLRVQGRPGEAETWWRQAAELGQAQAMTDLGVLLRRHGDQVAAETWLRRSAQAGHVPGMYNLALLLKDRGNEEESRSWWRRATSPAPRQ